MKAIVKKEAREGVWLEEIEIPTPADDELLIKVSKTSICGTDIHLYLWDEVARKHLPVPSVIGHEFVGHVAAMGKAVRGFKEGDRITGEGHITCGRCRQCQMERRVLCPNTFNIALHGKGCFANYFTFPAKNAFPLPDELPDEIAALFDPYGNAVHTALSTDLVGKDVLITGAGPIGLMSIPVVKKAGARRVVISDMNPYRLDLARKFGVDAAVNIREQSIRDVMDSLSIVGFDVCLEMSGSGAALASLPQLAGFGAHVALLGFPLHKLHLIGIRSFLK